MRRKALMLVVFAVLFGVAGPDARALCVNNGTAVPVKVQVLVGGKFKSKVAPGQMQCCDWQKASCNAGGDAFSNLQFVVTALAGPQVRTGVCRGTIPASYEIQIREAGDKIRCVGVK